MYAADQSAQVIKAYYTLLDPLSRAQYMVSYPELEAKLLILTFSFQTSALGISLELY